MPATREPQTRSTAPAIPAELDDFANAALGGPVRLVADLSWPYDGSEVYRVAARGADYIVKRLLNRRFFDREVRGLGWCAGLGDRFPRLAGSSDELLAVAVTVLPGQVVKGLDLDPREEREVLRQTGELAALLHGLFPPVRGDTRVLDRLLPKVERFIGQAGSELDARQCVAVRAAARTLAEAAPHLDCVACHGDAQLRNVLWDGQIARLIDFERSEIAPAVRDFVALEAGPFFSREDLREAFYAGYGHALSDAEQAAMAAWIVIDAVSGLAWGIPNGDDTLVMRSRRVLAAA